MSELYSAYAEYLERMLDDSDDLTLVDPESVPEGIDLTLLEEWGSFVD